MSSQFLDFPFSFRRSGNKQQNDSDHQYDAVDQEAAKLLGLATETGEAQTYEEISNNKNALYAMVDKSRKKVQYLFDTRFASVFVWQLPILRIMHACVCVCMYVCM